MERILDRGSTPLISTKKKSTTKWCEFFLLGMSELKRRKSKMSGGDILPDAARQLPSSPPKKEHHKVVNQSVRYAISDKK